MLWVWCVALGLVCDSLGALGKKKEPQKILLYFLKIPSRKKLLFVRFFFYQIDWK